MGPTNRRLQCAGRTYAVAAQCRISVFDIPNDSTATDLVTAAGDLPEIQALYVAGIERKTRNDTVLISEEC